MHVADKSNGIDFDIDTCKLAVTDILNKYSPRISILLRGDTMLQFAREMQAAKFIGNNDINSSYDTIMSIFKGLINQQKTKTEVQNHCSNFIKILKRLGGPLTGAAVTIELDWNSSMPVGHICI